MTIESDPNSVEWLPTIIQRLLSVGVPPTAIANAFELEVEPIKDIQVSQRIAKYGTAELSEAIQWLMWKAYDDIIKLIESAPPARRLSLNMALMTKASALAGSQTPDSVARMQAELGEIMRETRGVTQEASTSIYESHPIDAPPDDPEKGFEG